MDRRRFLLSVGIGGAISLSGCIGPFSNEELPQPSIDEGENEVNMVFERDNERIMTVSVQFIEGYREESNSVPLKVTFWHKEQTKIEDIWLKLRSPPTRSGVPNEIYMLTPDGNPFPEIEFYKDSNDLGTILDTGSIGEIGQGSITLDFLLKPLNQTQTINLYIETEVTLSENGILGNKYTGTGQTTTPIGSQ